jgi:hypothetical protein
MGTIILFPKREYYPEAVSVSTVFFEDVLQGEGVAKGLRCAGWRKAKLCVSAHFQNLKP